MSIDFEVLVGEIWTRHLKRVADVWMSRTDLWMIHSLLLLVIPLMLLTVADIPAIWNIVRHRIDDSANKPGTVYFDLETSSQG